MRQRRAVQPERIATDGKCLLFHSYEVVKNTGFTVYLRCRRCKRRLVLQGRGGYQPIDQTWLDTGEWTKVGKPPNADTGVAWSPEFKYVQ